MFISETWFKENSCPNLGNYILHRKDRISRKGEKEARNGGGVCIYIKKSIVYDSYVLEENYFGLSDPSIETVWCCCLINEEKLLLGCIYRPGDASIEANK